MDWFRTYSSSFLQQSTGGPVYAPILPSRAYDHTPAPSPPPHLKRPVSDIVIGKPVLLLD